MLLQQAYRRVILPAYESGWKRRRTYAYWRELEESQWQSADELRERQLGALRALLIHAGANCPHYRDEWRELGLDPHGVDSLETFQRWPLVTRDVIRRRREEMRDPSRRSQLISKATGGSSGEPLGFDLDPGSYERREAAWHRGYAWAGAAPGTRQVYLWGVPLGEQTRAQRVKQRVHQGWLYRRHVLNSFELNERTVPEFHRALAKVRPDALVAYTNPLYAFARSLEERGLKPYSPKSIVVGAEKLHGFQRELIERVFRAPVFETYGSREFMLIAAECDRHEGLHLTMENLLVELLDDQGRPVAPGEEGDVVVTDLHNYGMPFIRYVTGDRAIAAAEPCSCGRGLPMLSRVVGRKLDMLTTPDARTIPGEFFPHLIKDYPAVRKFQVVQERADEILVKLVVDQSWSGEARESLEREVRKTVGDAVALRTVTVDDIPLTRAGKLQVVVNRVGDRRQAEAVTSA